MAVSLADFKAYLGAGDGTDTDDALLSALEAATDYLDRKVSSADIPESVYNQVLLGLGSEFYKRKDSPTGNSQYTDFSTGQPVAGPRDPLAQWWPVLRGVGVLPF